MWTQAETPAEVPRDEAGVATLALVLVVPGLVLLVSMVAQFAILFHAANLATAAAQEAARSAQLVDGTASTAQAHGEDFLAQAGPNLVLDPVVTVTRDALAQVARVQVSGRAPRLIPGLPLAIRAEAGGPLERFEAPAP